MAWARTRFWWSCRASTIRRSVEEVIQSTAKLAIHAVAGGPYDSDQAALQANGGVIPPDSMLVQRIGLGGRSGPGLAAEAGERGGRNGLPRCAAFDGPERPAEHYAST